MPFRSQSIRSPIPIRSTYHFLRELVEKKEIESIHVASQYQHADFLTKALPEREFEVHRGIVMNLK